MPVISRVVSMILRAGELAFAGIVAGIVGKYLHDYRSGSDQPLARFIYIEIVAGISLLLGLLWLLPFASGFVHWPVDVFVSAAWFAGFGVLVQWRNSAQGACAGDTFAWDQISLRGTCGRWRATEAFSFLSAIFWLVSALVGVWFIHRERRKAGPAAGT
ncbi:uncharacterized protein A1O9_10833 [Exophiala aquamarina CBS 119918]|uniref:MARVEL domain-containing protein n=1 Tax=Exophiala aquamarina CBS 119918 TaxID=1182545 RepID=A0A072NZT0_9EURO|nr:uncharacterized protein A1O9_10833 [Exophiala aquamarina CBS 119918]KEF52927.1 hypothetical protein A1O9_10833 [Exophiala aquamarina CBS 119918]